MSEHEGRGARAVYDHEVDDSHPSGRRRAVADWGVGEEIFDHLPRRRFRHSEPPRRETHARERRGGRFEPAGDEPHPAEGRDRRDERPRSSAPERSFDEPVTPAPIAPIEPAPPAPQPAEDMSPPPEGRRTVVIRGRGAEPAWTPRSRPPRTVGERIGPRPDRLAAWAVALGMLLILIAILTAHG